MKKIFFSIIVSLFTVALLNAQTRDVYAKFIKPDGSKIKGTSTKKKYEDQVIITSFTGGSDNSATIEIEVVTGTYVADFRNVMNATATNNTTIAPAKSISNAAIARKVDMNKTPVAQLKPAQQLGLASAEITVTTTNTAQQIYSRPVNKIVLQNIQVENCVDNAASGTSKMKLKASRIGWVYYNYDIKGNSTISKTGWDATASQAWNNF